MFVSVKEAAELTGKSATTIYRLCNKRINTEYVRKEDNKFLINKEFLLATYPPEETEEVTFIEDEQPEMRFENVVEATPSNEMEEKAVALEKTESSSNQLYGFDNEYNLEKGTKVEFEESTQSSYYNLIRSKEVIIGLLVSLVVIFLFIYLISVISS